MSGAVPPSAARPLGWAARVPRPVFPGRGWGGRGDQAPVPQHALLPAVVARHGGCGRASPGGGAFHRCEGRLNSGALPSPASRPVGGLSGSATRVLWARVRGRGGPALLVWPACPAGTCMPRGWRGLSRGGWPSTVVRGIWCQAVTPPDARPLGQAARAPRPVFPGCCCCGRGDPLPTSQRALLRAVVARCEGGGRAPPEAAPCAVVRGV